MRMGALGRSCVDLRLGQGLKMVGRNNRVTVSSGWFCLNFRSEERFERVMITFAYLYQPDQ